MISREQKILPFRFGPENIIDSYREELILIEGSPERFETKSVNIKETIGIIGISGKMEGMVAGKSFLMNSPGLLILLKGNDLLLKGISKDFSGFFIISTEAFTDRLNIEFRLTVFLSLRLNPVIELSSTELSSLKDYFKTVQKILRQINNPFAIKTIQHYTEAFFYGFNGEKLKGGKVKYGGSGKEALVENFLRLVQQNYKTQKQIKFYADLLFMTSKHLSKTIHENSGWTAKQWIDDFIMQDSKRLLKTTFLTIQEISDYLNFPNQSFFGKFFKHRTGLSPKEYRRNLLKS